MTMWTAPPITRADVPRTGDERTMLDGWLDYHRETLQLKCAGLTPQQLVLRSVEPSTLSLLGLVRHLAEVERWWFRQCFAGMELRDLFCTEATPDGDFDDAVAAGAEADLATLTAEIDLARKAAVGHSLDETFQHPHRPIEVSLRWVYTHMIEEYARHNGHADIIRERIDGVTGE
jgi:hypothetical protein